MENNENTRDRRGKARFRLQRDLRFRILEGDRVVLTGTGTTVDISSAGVAFQTEAKLNRDTLIELSISWPVLLDESCLMQLITFGHIVRISRKTIVSSIDRYEFRTQARSTPISRPPIDSKLRRWVGTIDKDLKASASV